MNNKQIRGSAFRIASPPHELSLLKRMGAAERRRAQKIAYDAALAVIG